VTERERRDRTKAFALGILKLVDAIPDSRAGRIVASQIGRCATSVGANYRAACRSRSPAEMISKFAIVEEEADETVYWLEIATERGLVPAEMCKLLSAEASELTAIMIASRRTLQRRTGREQPTSP
jgi:four helix bundle protein